MKRTTVILLFQDGNKIFFIKSNHDDNYNLELTQLLILLVHHVADYVCVRADPPPAKCIWQDLGRSQSIGTRNNMTILGFSTAEC